MKLGLIVASLFVVGTAYAQAPGEYEEVAAPGMAVPVAPIAPPPPPEQRWSVGLGFGSLGLAPHDAPDAESHFSIGQIAVRWRPWRHLELELALGGGGEKFDDGTEGDREVSSGVLGLRYRFNPHARWNGWLMAGMGSLTVAQQGASDDERKALQQSTLQFGGGIERRWSHFALQAELRAVGVAPIDEGDQKPMSTTVISTSTGMEPYPNEPNGYLDGWSGGQLTISGNYYF